MEERCKSSFFFDFYGKLIIKLQEILDDTFKFKKLKQRINLKKFPIKIASISLK